MALNHTLHHGIKIGENVLKELTIRECTVQDTLDAANDMQGGTTLALQVQVMRRRIVKIGDVSGPLAANVIASMHDIDFELMMEATEKFDDQRDKEAREALGMPDTGRS